MIYYYERIELVHPPAVFGSHDDGRVGPRLGIAAPDDSTRLWGGRDCGHSGGSDRHGGQGNSNIQAIMKNVVAVCDVEEEIVGDAEASKMLRYDYRAPWELPKVG